MIVSDLRASSCEGGPEEMMTMMIKVMMVMVIILMMMMTCEQAPVRAAQRSACIKVLTATFTTSRRLRLKLDVFNRF